MSEASKQVNRLSKIARELNVGITTIVEFLNKKGKNIESSPNTKVPQDIYEILLQEFQSEKSVKEKAKQVEIGTIKKKESVYIPADEENETANTSEDEEKGDLLIKDNSFSIGAAKEKEHEEEVFTPNKELKEEPKIKILGKINLDKPKKEDKPQSEAVVEAPKKEEKPEIKAELPKEESKKEPAVVEDENKKGSDIKILGKIDLDNLKPKKEVLNEPEKAEEVKEKEEKPVEKHPLIEQKEMKEEKTQIIEEEKVSREEEKIEVKEDVEEDNFLKTQYQKLNGPTILGKIDLPVKKEEKKKQPVASSANTANVGDKKKKRKRIKKEGIKPETVKQEQQGGPKREQSAHGHTQNKDKAKFKDNKKKVKDKPKTEVSEEDIQKQIRETLARLSGSGKSKSSKHRRMKREQVSMHMQEELEKQMEQKHVLKVTEFVTANELATMMNVPVTQVISTCMALGMFVSINQRLDAETLSIVAEEFGYKVEFVSVELQEAILEEEDKEEDMSERPPIVTVMGHVDHGKTSLLDYIRKTNVIAGEAGGITQHIGAYAVKLDNGKQICFLDTPGHEAFTAMRARGAQVTDIAIIVIAADDSVMPQTVEAINHAQAAGVPIVFAINKIDKPGANSEKIREALANMNILVEDWGGKYQCQEISAKKGLNIEVLLDKVLLEAEMLELKGNPVKRGVGTVIESQLDKGRGYVATILVQSGVVRIGDPVLAGCYFGRVKAMFNERNIPVKEAGPSTPIQLLGLNGAPQAGDQVVIVADEKEAKNIATKRLQLQREQGIRTQKHITLDEIGRRIAIGDFKELNIIVKGDVDGSIEALTDSLLKLSTEKIQVNVIHKSVGQVSESDVLLASASNAIIIAFQVRPSLNARRLAEKEEIDIRTYSIIYDAINEVKDAMEGMLSPEIQEKITCNIEVREVFKISKVGSIAGCFVLDGKINRHTKVRLIRDGIVVYSGDLGSLKRFKDDAKEVYSGQDCGLSIKNFNDIKPGDLIEGFEEIEIKAKL